MVFENVTLFELHLDDARFGDAADRLDRLADRRRSAGAAARAETSTDDDETADDEGSGTGRVRKLVVASVVVSLVATLVARRVAGGDDEGRPVEVGPEPTLSADADPTDSTTDAESGTPSADETP